MPGYGDHTDTVLRPMGGRPPDQIAYIVEDLEAGVRKLAPVFGVYRWLGWRYTASYLPHRAFRGAAGDFESHGVVAEFGPSLEIIAPLSGKSVFTEFLERHGPGLHHIGYFVDNLDRERQRMIALGYREVQYGGGHGMDGDGKISYFEAVEGARTYIELIEPPKRRHAPHFEIIVTPDPK